MSISKAAATLEQWMMDESLPLWADAGMHASGGACEALDFAGVPLPGNESRVRVQARQLYSFALAHQLGWQPERSRQIVENLLGVISSLGRRADGVYGRRIDLAAGELVDDTADLYDNAFALLGLANARQVLDAKEVDPLIASFWQALDAGMSRGADSGYAEVLPAPAQRLQNPHMHLFESTLALYAVTREAQVAERARALRAFVDATFFDETHACVFEIAGSGDPAHRETFEPGHSMEWVWLLGWQARLFDEPYPAFGRKLYARAVETLDDKGRALMQVATTGERSDSSRRLWSQTETLKAHLCIMELSAGEEAAAAESMATACAQNIYEEWLQPAVAGGWHDHFDADGKLVAPFMPASSGYHVYCAIAELMRIASRRD